VTAVPSADVAFLNCEAATFLDAITDHGKTLN
jgi:hypothetical protein